MKRSFDGGATGGYVSVKLWECLEGMSVERSSVEERFEEREIGEFGESQVRSF